MNDDDKIAMEQFKPSYEQKIVLTFEGCKGGQFADDSVDVVTLIENGAKKMSDVDIPKTKQSQPTILSFAVDLPNLCSLAGLACTIMAIYCSILGVYYGAMIGMVWAVAFDWADGIVARKMKGRTGTDSAFGGQLDVLIDIVSYGVAPAILLLSYGKFEPVFLLGAFILLATAALRLSYFSIFGLS